MRRGALVALVLLATASPSSAEDGRGIAVGVTATTGELRSMDDPKRLYGGGFRVEAESEPNASGRGVVAVEIGAVAGSGDVLGSAVALLGWRYPIGGFDLTLAAGAAVERWQPDLSCKGCRDDGNRAVGAWEIGAGWRTARDRWFLLVRGASGGEIGEEESRADPDSTLVVLGWTKRFP